MLLAVIATLVPPLLLSILPVTRRRAKVRTRHIVRAGGYGFLILALVLLSLAFVYAAPNLVSRDASGSLVPDWLLLTWPIWCVWMLLWWFFAIRRYLRLPHVIPILLFSSIITFLLWLVILAYID